MSPAWTYKAPAVDPVADTFSVELHFPQEGPVTARVKLTGVCKTRAELAERLRAAGFEPDEEGEP